MRTSSAKKMMVNALNKVSKTSVDYKAATTHKHCGNCSMYRKVTGLEGRCTLVAGTIRTDFVCNEWEKEK
jgi:High potential iron-sulfur protein